MKNLNLSTALLAKLTVLFFCLFFYNGSAWAGACDTIIAEDSTTQLTCADNDELTVNEGVSLNYTGKNAVFAHTDDNVNSLQITEQ